MATDKRDRQRANREEKRARDAKVAKRRHWFNLAKKWAIYFVLFAGGLLAFRYFFG